MELEYKRVTAPYSSVGAEEGQSPQTKNSIADAPGEINPPEEDLEEDLCESPWSSYGYDPDFLHTMSMNDLYENVYEGRPPVVEGLLYTGTYLFVGAPKVGKSFFMAQLAWHISTGTPLWA